MNRSIPIAVTAVAALAAGALAGSVAALPPAQAAPSGTSVSVVATSLAGDRLTTKSSLAFGALSGVPDIRVDASRQYQGIDGFGATFNEAGWETLTRPSVSAAQRDAVMTKLFSPTSGAGFSIARTPIGSDDFSLTHYSYDETPGDFALSNFSVAHDQQYLIPYIQAAQAKAGGAFRLMASPWTAPSWMKKNGSLLGKPGDPTLIEPSTDARYYQAYADYFAKYVAAYQAQGITVTDVSIQNEPENPAAFEATTFTDQQMASFVGGYLGPTFDSTGTAARIRVYEHNQDHWWYPANVLADPAVARYASGANFHPYECDFGQTYCSDANLDLFNQAAPGYSTWMSEHTDLGQAEPNNYIRDEKWSREIVKQINHGEGAYIYWNMVLDQDGGPVTDLSAPQEPLVEVDTSTSPATVSYLPKYYELAQFSKFVKPGAHRISAAGGVTGDDVVQTAFENPDGSRVLVAVNSGPAATVTVGEDANGFSATLAAHSTTTFTWSGPKGSYSLDSGSTGTWTDIAGEHYTADSLVTGGTTASTTGDIANTADDALYRTTRNGTFSYALPVPSGRYRVTVLLSDNSSTAAGQRVFNVTAEGSTRLSNVDPYASGGGAKSASRKNFYLNVTDGTLNIATVAVTGTPSIAGIRVTPMPTTGAQHASTVSGGLPAGYTTDTGVLPGTIFAQDYNDGGAGVAYTIANPVAGGASYRADGTNLVTTTDTTYGGGLQLTGLSTGDKLNYTVDVVAGGNYDLKARVSSTVATGKYSVLLDGVSLGTVSVPNTAGAWSDVPMYGVAIPAGTHTLTFVVTAAGYDLRTLTASRVNAIATGAVIEAEDYAAGGEGVGYHDTTAGNGNTTYGGAPLRGYYRGGDVDLESSWTDTSQPDNFDVGSTADGEWLRYDVYAATSGSYDISARVASGFTSGKIQYALDSTSNVISPSVLTVPNTNGWQTWISETQRVTIPNGPHALYVLVTQGGFNLDRITVTPAGQGWAKTVGFGSSYAAGPGISPNSSPNARGYIKNGVTGSLITCERSRWNAVNYLADRFGQRDEFYDASCPGDKSVSIANPTNADGSTSSIGDEIAEASAGYRSTEPGSGALGTGTTTVTVSIGGNDVYSSSDGAYTGSVTGQMYACYQKSCVDASGDPTATNSDGTKGLRAADITVAKMTTNLRPIVDRIRAIAPNARIRFIGYPSVFGTGTVSCSGGSGTSAWEYTATETAYLQGLLNKLTDTENTVLQQIRTAEGLTTTQLDLVDIRTDSQSHGVCEPLNQRWIAQPTGDTSAAGIHPNLSMFALEARLVSTSF